MPDSPEMVKVAFRDAEGHVETLWAFPLGDGRFKVDNSPWYQYGVSWHDIVSAQPEADGLLFFSHVIEKGGHRTLRVVCEEEPVPQQLLQDLQDLGCTYEGANPRYIAVDVPPGIDLGKAAELLVQSGLQWEYADPTYEELQFD